MSEPFPTSSHGGNSSPHPARTVLRRKLAAPVIKDVEALVKRRRVLPLASTAAAIGLAGCALGGGAETAQHEPMQQDKVSVLVNPRQADQKVRDYSSSIEAALDQIDRERLRAAAEKSAAPNAGQPAAPAAPTAGSGSPAVPVILATSGAGEKTPGAVAPPIVAAASNTTAGGGGRSAAGPIVEPKVARPAVESAAALGMDASKTAPAALAPTVTTPKVEAAPIAAQAPSVSEITPIAAPPSSTPSAMGSMTAMVMPAPEPAPAAPMAAIPAVPEEPSVESAVAVLRKRVAAHPTLGTALAMSLLDLGDGKSAEVAKELPESDQKVLADLVAALQGMNLTTSTGATVADRAAPLVEASKKWQTDADLGLPKLVLATRVDSFGVYNAIEPKFEQGKKHTVIIYCEVANFSAKKSDDGWFQTRLSQQETLITEDGLLVWRPNAEEVEDKSLNRRRDFYLVKKLTIPESLAAGKYMLQMKVTDRNANKFSMVSLPLEIVTK